MTSFISCLGDSLTYVSTLGVKPGNLWPTVLSRKLNALGCNTKTGNFGRSGITSTTMLTRLPLFNQFFTPALTIIWIGANDPGGSIVTATTLLNLRCAIRHAKFGCVGVVAGQANLPASGKVGDRYVVQVDTSTTGGVPATDSSMMKTLTGAGGSAITVWEYRGALAGEYGWGRVATAETAPTYCGKIMVVSMHYQNFTTAGDTLATPYAAYATLRTGAQIPAAAAEGVVYVDLYNFMRNRIVAGTDYDQTGGLNAARLWHYADQNQHFNQYGNEIVAEAVLQAIQAQPGWINALVN